MRRAVTAVVVLALVAGAAMLAVWVRDRYLFPVEDGGSSTTSRTPAVTRSPSPSTPRPTSTSVAKPKPTVTPVAGVPRRPKNAQPMTVRYVYDGDTLQLQAGKPGAYVTTKATIKVRLIGVDAPEMTPKKQCYAQQATDRLRALAPAGSTVWVAPDKDSWDDYRRRLFHVWTDSGVLIDHDLVARGFGRALRIWPNVTYWPVMEQAQATAQKQKRGLWKAC